MNKVVYRKYHISIVFGRNYYYKETKALKLPKIILPYVIGYLISLPTILLGFGDYRVFRSQSQGFNNTIRALSVNFAGGLDKTNETNYDAQTVHVYKNLYRETREEVGIDNVDLIIEVAKYFKANNKVKNKYKIEEYINLSFEKLDIKELKEEHLQEIIETIELLSENGEVNFA